jgi:hypothetical protein
LSPSREVVAVDDVVGDLVPFRFLLSFLFTFNHCNEDGEFEEAQTGKDVPRKITNIHKDKGDIL